MHKIMQRGDEHMTEGLEISQVLPVSQQPLEKGFRPETIICTDLWMGR